MNPPGGFPLRPRQLGELLDLTFRIYRAHFRTFALLGLTVSAGQFGLVLYIGLLLSRVIEAEMLEVLLVLGLGLVVVAATIALSLQGNLAICAAADAAFHGRPVEFGAAWRSAASRLGAAAKAVLPAWVLSFLGLLLCILPGVVAIVLLVLTPVVVLLERRSGFDAMARSRELVAARGPKGLTIETNWVRILLMFIVVMIVAGVFQAVAKLPEMMATAWAITSGREPTTTLFGPQFLPLSVQLPLQALAAGVQGLIGALYAIPWLLLYYDIRTRDEGLDLALALERLEADGGAEVIGSEPRGHRP